jgi:RHS repeat-associated protein
MIVIASEREALGRRSSNRVYMLLFRPEPIESDLAYGRPRYYDPTVGQFTTVDPFSGNFEDPQSLHKYAYVHGDPVNGIDPTGMWWWDDDWFSHGVLGLAGVHGWGAFSEGWGEINKSAASTTDGLIPFFDPFEFAYANQDGTVDDVFLWSRAIAGFARDVYLARFIPNLQQWARNPLKYEVGSTTQSKILWESTLKYMTPVQRGEYLISLHGGVGRAIMSTSWSQIVNTVGTGLTPGGYLFGLAAFEFVNNWQALSNPINDLLGLSYTQAKGRLPIVGIPKRSILGQAIDGVLASINDYNYRLSLLIDDINNG